MAAQLAADVRDAPSAPLPRAALPAAVGRQPARPACARRRLAEALAAGKTRRWRPAQPLRRAAAGLRVSGRARRRRNAAWHAAAIRGGPAVRLFVGVGRGDLVSGCWFQAGRHSSAAACGGGGAGSRWARGRRAWSPSARRRGAWRLILALPSWRGCAGFAPAPDGGRDVACRPSGGDAGGEGAARHSARLRMFAGSRCDEFSATRACPQ